MSQKVVMICTLADEPAPLPSETRKCEVCDRAIWVSKASLKTAEDRGAVFRCWECVEIEEDSEVQAPSLEQIKEIIENKAH